MFSRGLFLSFLCTVITVAAMKPVFFLNVRAMVKNYILCGISATQDREGKTIPANEKMNASPINTLKRNR